MIMSAIDRIRHRDDEEGGFTLIELLVVVIIIGILAAIAIPTFLNQRKKGWESAVKSDLRNYAIVMETELTETGSYAAAFATTPPVESNDVTLTVPTADAATYCLEAVHAKLTDPGAVWSLQPGGVLTKAAC